MIDWWTYAPYRLAEKQDDTREITPSFLAALLADQRARQQPQAEVRSGGGIGLNINTGGSSGGLIGGFNGSPWDAAFSMIGPMHGALEGNDPSSPFVPKGRQKTDKEWMVGAGAPIGGLVGSIFGMPGAGAMAGQNVGATLADLTSGNIHNLGMDVSANLPPIPGMQQPGWKGLVNGATGLPIGTLLGKAFK